MPKYFEVIFWFFAIFGFLSSILLTWVIVYALIIRRKIGKEAETELKKIVRTYKDDNKR